jgi:hypothetical protein
MEGPAGAARGRRDVDAPGAPAGPGRPRQAPAGPGRPLRPLRPPARGCGGPGRGVRGVRAGDAGGARGRGGVLPPCFLFHLGAERPRTPRPRFPFNFRYLPRVFRLEHRRTVWNTSQVPGITHEIREVYRLEHRCSEMYSCRGVGGGSRGPDGPRTVGTPVAVGSSVARDTPGREARQTGHTPPRGTDSMGEATPHP